MCFESQDLWSSTSHTTLAYNMKECHAISSLLGLVGIIAMELLRMLENFRLHNSKLPDTSYTKFCATDSPRDRILTFLCCYLRQWHPTPVLLPGKSHGRRSLVGCSPWGHEESDTTERLHFHFSLSCIGEGNGDPLQCSCLENPRDGGFWWAGGLPSTGSHRVEHDWSELAAAAAACTLCWRMASLSIVISDYLCVPGTPPCSVSQYAN